MAKKSFIKRQEIKQPSKVLSIRVPGELHDKIATVMSLAVATDMELNLTDVICSHLKRVLNSAEKEMKAILRSGEVNDDFPADDYDVEW